MRTRPIRLTAGAVIATALVAGAVACGNSSAGTGRSGSATKTESITVAIPPVISGAAVFVAQAEGYFAKKHLSVSVKLLNGGAAIVPAMEGGSVQVGETNVLSVIQGAAHNIDEPCFSGAFTDPSSGHYLSLVASAKAGVHSAAQLAGKTVAVNATAGVNQLLVDAYLSSHHVNPTSVRYISLQFPDMPAALSSGRVAAAVTSEPFTSEALGQGGNLLAGSPLQYIPGTPTYACWNAQASWLASHKIEAAEFASAIAEADAYIVAQPAGFRRIAASHLSTTAQKLSAVSMPSFTSSLTSADITAWEKAARQYHLLTGTPSASSVLDLAH